MSNRKIKDAALEETSALPAAAANNSTAAIDLGQVTAFPLNESIDVEMYCPATPALTDDDTITFTLQDSANGTDFAAIAGLSTVVTLGAGAAGAAAFSRIVKLPGTTRRYVRVNAAVLTGGGNNTGVTYGVRVLA